jgi:hypothetical protein
VSVPSVAILVDRLIAARMSSSSSSCSAETEDTGPLKIPQLRRFESSRFPQISIHDYVERLKKFGHFDTALVVALVYMDRLIAADPNFAVTYRNVHRLLLTCATVAEKYYNDIYYCNTYYANVGGIGLPELNRLEVTLLYALMWRLKVSDEEFSAKQRELSRAFDIASSNTDVDEEEQKQVMDVDSEPSTQASVVSGGTQSVSGSDESMDSDSDGDVYEDAYDEAGPSESGP